MSNSPKLTLATLLPVLLFAAMGLVFFVALQDKAAERTTVASESLTRQAPPLRTVALDDTTKPSPALDAWKGHKVIVNFFASWCTPCLAEHPLLQQLAASKSYKIYGVAWKDSAEKIKTYLNDHGNPYDAVGLDPQSLTGIDYGIHGVPESFVINEQGVIIERIAGPLTEEKLKQLLGK